MENGYRRRRILDKRELLTLRPPPPSPSPLPSTLLRLNLPSPKILLRSRFGLSLSHEMNEPTTVLRFVFSLKNFSFRRKIGKSFGGLRNFKNGIRKRRARLRRFKIVCFSFFFIFFFYFSLFVRWLYLSFSLTCTSFVSDLFPLLCLLVFAFNFIIYRYVFG